MKRLPLSADDETILQAADEWVDLLVEKKFQEALDFLCPDRELGFTAESLENWIRNYGWHDPLKDGSVMEVTPRQTAIGKHPERDLERYDPPNEPIEGRLYLVYVWYQVPLNGEWSDLIVEFDIYEFEGNTLFGLSDFRVK